MNNRRGTRRGFLGSLGAAPLIADAGLVTGTNTGRPPDLPILGEPYALLGRRLAFLNWYYIRTGGFRWVDASGKKVGLSDRVAPGSAQFRPEDQPSGVRLIAQPARRMGPLFQAEKPWEEGSVAITTVLKDGGMFRGWSGPFTTSGNPPGQKYFVYFESNDGIHWKRPNLGIVEENRSRSNNIVNIFGTDGGSIFIDPSAPTLERYKLIAEGPFSREICDAYQRKRPNGWDARTFRRPDGSGTGVKAAVSADGLHWNNVCRAVGHGGNGHATHCLL